MTKSCRRLQYEPGLSILEQRLAGRALVRLVRKGIQRLLVACPACYREAVVLYSAQPLSSPIVYLDDLDVPLSGCLLRG